MLSPTSPIGECESNWKSRLAAMERPLNEYWASLNGTRCKVSPTRPTGECESNWKGRLAAMERALNEYWASLNRQGAGIQTGRLYCEDNGKSHLSSLGLCKYFK